MAKMKTPTLEEVKEYFKDAEKIQSIIGRKFKNDGKFRGSKYAMAGDTSIYAKNGKYEVWNQLKGYAKILSYKKPKEKTYKITKTQLEQLHRQGNDYTKFDIEYLFPEVFETKLTVGKWYWRYNKKELAVWNDGKITYGFRYDGLYLDRFSFTDTTCVEEATEQEVTEALIKEAVRRGFVGNKYIDISALGFKNDDLITGGQLEYKDGWLNFGELRTAIFHNGVWGSVIPTLTIQEAEAKLKEIGVNAKIV